MTYIKILDKDLPLKIEWLRSFLAVTDAGGFTKAARALNLSQPAVSTHVAELEANLGTKLFEHLGGRISLTRSGEAVARESRRILDDVRGLVHAVAESEGEVQGVIKVGASTTPGNYILPALLARFERRHPRARAMLAIGNSGKIVELLRVNEVDLGVVGLDPDREEFASRPAFDDEIVPFAASDHPLGRARRATTEALSRERFLLRERASATRRLADAWLARRRLHPPVMELGCPETIKRAAAAGLGIGILSRHSIDWEVRQGHLAELRVPDFPIRRKLYVVRHRQKHVSRAIASLLEVLLPAPRPKRGT